MLDVQGGLSVFKHRRQRSCSPAGSRPPGHIAGPALEPQEASPVLSLGWLPRVMALQSRCHLRMQSEARKAVLGKRTSFFLSLAAVTQASSCSLCARNPEMMLPPPPNPAAISHHFLSFNSFCMFECIFCLFLTQKGSEGTL